MGIFGSGKVTARLSVSSEVGDAIKQGGERVRKAVWGALQRSGQKVARDAKLNIRKNFGTSKGSDRKRMRRARKLNRRGGATSKQLLATRGATGNLSRSIMTREQEGKMRVTVGSSAIYGRIRELGGIIRPRRKPRLAWIDPDTGEWVVLRRGQSVTQKGKPYLKPALTQNAGWIRNEVSKAVQQALQQGGDAKKETRTEETDGSGSGT